MVVRVADPSASLRPTADPLPAGPRRAVPAPAPAPIALVLPGYERFGVHAGDGLQRLVVGRFPNGELHIEVPERVEGRRCILVGSISPDGESLYDTTFENVQAGERTSHLFRLANHHRGLVLGTGDLSELALGWSTYGVGDQMSHYNVNASVPKTLIQFLLRWTIDTNQFGEHLSEVLASVLETTITPELIPAADPQARDPQQDSESVIGPFALQDFFLYYTLRFGYRPSKVAFLAHHAWRDRRHGSWPDLIPDHRRSEYSLAEIKHWLEVFLHRFFQTSQFKRSAIPNAPKVGSGGSLSPRGDWRAPSDSSATVWLEELRDCVPDDT